jgi:hypothetical protein
VNFLRDFLLSGGQESRPTLTRRIPRSSIKEHVRRLLNAIDLVFQVAGLRVDPRKVLIVQETLGNEVGYKLKATCTVTRTVFRLLLFIAPLEYICKSYFEIFAIASRFKGGSLALPFSHSFANSDSH